MSGNVMILMAAGGAAQLVLPATIQRLVVDPADATANISFDTDGDGQYSSGSSGFTAFDWWTLAPVTGIGSRYWIRLTVNSGTSPTSGDSVGSWLALSSARSWSLLRTTIGTTTGNYTIAIASDAAGANIVASDTFNFTATVDS